MTSNSTLGGVFTPAGTNLKLNRMGYGAMQLAGPHVFGPPKDRDAAVAVLRAAVEAGVNHIDTSDFYGPYVTNEIIREALHPYASDLTIVTKIGALRDAEGNWPPARSPEQLTQAVHDNLKRLGLDVLEVVNLRLGGRDGPEDGSLEPQMSVMLDLQRQGLIRHIGLSTVSAAQYREAVAMGAVVCIQNQYNIAHRGDDAFIEALGADGVAYVPYFPLGGFTPLQSSTLSDAAKALDATPMQVALAWLLQRAPNILLIPGTSSVTHLRENLAAASLALPADAVAELDGIGGAAKGFVTTEGPEAPSAGAFAGPEHRLPVRVYYEDTDFTGLVYHANYVRFFERGRSDFLRLIGIGHTELARQDTVFAVTRLDIAFHRAARIDDALVVASRLLMAKGVRVRFAQSILRDDQVIASGAVEVACIDRAGRPRRPPPGLAAALIARVDPAAG